MNGHLLEVDPALARRLRTDPELVAQVTTRHELGMGGLGGVDPADGPAMLDAAIAGAGPIGCLWRLAPRFLRRWLLGRLMKGASAAPRPAAEVDAEVERLRRELAEHAEDPDDDDPDDESDEARLTDQEREMVRQMRASFASVTAAADPDAPPIEGTGPHLDLHKDWHLLHFCLTGTADEAPPPAGDAILGGEEIGDDLGYGPARILSPERVAAVAGFLRDLGPGGVVARFRPRAMGEDVYGSDFATEGGFEEEIRAQAERLCRFYAAAAERGASVLVWIS